MLDVSRKVLTEAINHCYVVVKVEKHQVVNEGQHRKAGQRESDAGTQTPGGMT